MLPTDIASDYPFSGPSSGKTYSCADGTTIGDEGERTIIGKVRGRGKHAAMRFRVTQVARGLLCVAELVDQGMKIVFDKEKGIDISHMVDKRTGEHIPVDRRLKTYELLFDMLPF